MRMTTISIVMFALLSSSAAMAAGQMKPGLWDMSIKSDAMKNVPKMSPEQLAMMKKHGVNLPQMQDGAITSKVCISREMAERDNSFMDRQESGCETKNYKRSGSTFTADIVCDGPQMKGAGKVNGTFAGNESFSSNYAFKGVAHGQPIDMKQETSGKWLSADCGQVKPADQMVKKK
jgi:hypothetical protein